ncbi:uncharacterized protein LOC129759139 [Uranotaenia lowii]|uniref:uncharacterized protein LOC129759139 n=1 Tax=Uranotaenia lowii TaxID=190385 RepID=UPI002478C0CD|nr:uncharacterized protein LOC129759139 [Uranotaenia lowii]
MPREDLRLLVKQERNLRSLMDNIQEFVNEYQAERDYISLKYRMEKLDDVYDKFVRVREQIEVITDDADMAIGIEGDEEQAALERAMRISEREEVNMRIIKDFENRFFLIKHSLGVLEAAESGSNIHQAKPPTVVDSKPRIKLPELKLPTFSGTLQEWITFRDTFTSMIHNNAHLSDIEKFTYLRTSLTDDALTEIGSIELTSANYSIAWQTLQNSFENRKLLVKSYLDILFSVKPMEKESYEQLNRVVKDFETTLMMLQKLEVQTDGMSTILQHMVCQRLDCATLQYWESHHNSKEVPTYRQLIEFLKARSMVLRNISLAHSSQEDSKKQSRLPIVSHPGIQQKFTCPFCGDSMHSVFKCAKFMKMKVSDRVELVKKRSLCLNCLSSGHIARYCVKGSCQNCGRSHHTLLHAGFQVSQFNSGQLQAVQPSEVNACQPPPQNETGRPADVFPSSTLQNQNHPSYNPSPSMYNPPSSSTTDNPSTSHSSVLSANPTTLPTTVLLSTAVLTIGDRYGNTLSARALLDSGSQLCFMTERIAQSLKFQRYREYLPVKGIGQSSTCSTQSVSASIGSRYSDYRSTLKFHVLPKVTADLPVKRINISDWKIPPGIDMADPGFQNPGSIDLILGAEVFYDLLLEGQHKLDSIGPILQNTRLGWVVSGKVPEESRVQATVSASCTEERVDELLTRFWELESCQTPSTLSLEESACEKIFEETTVRDSSGRFVVRLPRKDYLIHQLGESKSQAERRFWSLECRLKSNPELKAEYSAFIHEYLELNHMTEVIAENEEDSLMPPPYYMPHHHVLRPESSTTKLRVVFDASATTSSGISLNQALMVGPVLQEDLLSIVLRFRLHRIAITADVAKMYRMIDVSTEDRRLQRILWRDSPEEPLRTFELTTVTYGTASAPYLATKCLQRIAEDGKEKYPSAAKTLGEDFYMDDCLTGADTEEEGIKKCSELNTLLASAKMMLRKYNSNNAAVLSVLPDQLRDSRISLELDTSQTKIKTLGLIWDTQSDCFHFSVPQWNASPEINKRLILSDFARLFDPLGLVGPVIVQAKIFLQGLWKQNCSWTETLSDSLQQWWLEYRSNLAGLSNLQVPRWVAYGSEIISVELHGFCDASTKAYGACIYVRCTGFNGEVCANLLISKSRVAPLDDVKRKKKKMTIPRLELSSALLLSHLYEKVSGSLRISAKSFFWTDSTIVKCWLSSPPSRWQMFVANRVSEIQHLTKDGVWNHVVGLDNPADVLSRGATPEELQHHQLWWRGPDWLKFSYNEWPKTAETDEAEFEHTLLEEATVAGPAQVDPPNEIFLLKSSYTKLVQIVAFCRRFSFNCKNRNSHRTGFLTVTEREEALKVLVKLAQKECFPQDIAAVNYTGEVKKTSKLKSLRPQLVNGILVVGGRLENAPIAVGRKHPMILDNHHPFTQLIVNHYHLAMLHAGPQLLTACVREKFWPLCLRNLARKVVHSCVRCFKIKPRVMEQVMADLPVERVTPAPPFTRVGVDYCGPFKYRFPIRNSAPRMCYVVIFVCLVTKACHIDMVQDLTTDGFIAALRRMIGRRGQPELILCDNATNFVGAKRELDVLRKMFNSQRAALAQAAAKNCIEMKFIPPRAPNFGGLWEAAVKSMKYHLKRVIGADIYTYDEFYTLLTQIEACLNSRPLTPQRDDPADLEVLSPGHFYVHRQLTALPEPSLDDLRENVLSRWQRVQRHMQTIWKKWSTAYLSDLQNRVKWTRQQPNLREGMMVLIKEDNLPPLKWALGRIASVHPGTDGNVRVVDIRTEDGIKSRAISKICLLPIRDNAAEREE